MILQDTPYGEIFRVMEREREKVNWNLEKELNRYHKEILKRKRTCRQYPLLHHCYYTVPDSKNRYLLWFRNHGESICFGPALVVNQDDGSRQLICLDYFTFKGEDGKTVRQDALRVFTGHFLRRYRERCHFGEGLSTEDLIAFFMDRNYEYSYALDPDKVSLKQYRDSCAWQMRDGVSFGTLAAVQTPDGKEILIERNNTFVAEENLFGRQKQHTLSRRELNRKIVDFNLSERK